MKQLIFAAMVFAATAVHAGLSDAPTISQSGKWKVVRTVDQMTDKPVCTGIYDNDESIQLSNEELYVKAQGGVRSVKLRFDDLPARNLRLATDTEKWASTVIIDGVDFDSLRQSNRLRANIVSQLDALFLLDLNLQGFNEALDNIRNVCPTAAEPVGPSAAAPALEQAEECSAAMRSRMQRAKLSAAQIAVVCDK